MKDYILDFNIDMNSSCIKELVSIAIDLLSTIKDNKQKGNIMCYYTFDNGENKISEVKMNEIVVDFLMGYVTIEKYDKRRD